MAVKWQEVTADGETVIGTECCGTSSFCLGGMGSSPSAAVTYMLAPHLWFHLLSLESGTRQISLTVLRGGVAFSSGGSPEFMC